MANETSKQVMRRMVDRRYSQKWIVGNGIDIGCGQDPLSNLSDYFPLMKNLKPWDLVDGDAMLMSSAFDSSYDFIHSSHCLEHLVDPAIALYNWIRICKVNGYLIITVPDEDLYEQGIWPSTFNSDHKWSFTINKNTSWSTNSVNIIDLLNLFALEIEIIKIEKLDSGFDYKMQRVDQTRGFFSESAIEFVLLKKGRINKPSSHFNINYLNSIVNNERSLRSPIELLFDFAVKAEELGKSEKVIDFCDAILKLDFNYTDAHLLASRHHLKLGNFDKGIIESEWMWRNNPNLSGSQIGLFCDIDGNYSNLSGKTVLLSADSGIGDTIQFVRYAKLVQLTGARVLVECQQELFKLLSNIPYIDEVLVRGHLKNTDFNYRVPLHNLLGTFNTRLNSIPCDTPYLYTLSEDDIFYKNKLACKVGVNIGLCWSGNSDLPRNEARSIPQGLISEIINGVDANFYSLQKGLKSNNDFIIDISDTFDDFSKTAALVKQLDLVITVDTAIAHLAGSLGKKTLLLNRFDSCWRWLEGRSDSPWYPSIFIIQQKTPGDWLSTLDLLHSKINSYLEELKDETQRV
jgi:SAM-dependent methyltransferase